MRSERFPQKQIDAKLLSLYYRENKVTCLGVKLARLIEIKETDTTYLNYTLVMRESCQLTKEARSILMY